MNNGITESQENLLQKVARESRKFFLRRMLQNANTEADRQELRNIENMLREVKENTNDIPWLSKFIGNVFKFGGSQAEQKYPSKKKK